MDHRDIRTLKILEEIDNDHAPSQRDLARHLNVSLGLVNSFVKRLAQKGYFKVTTIPKNRVKYILTPKGVAEKTRLTYEYIQYSVQFYKEARHNLLKLFKEMENQRMRRVVFYGAGDFAEIAYISLQESRIKLVAVFDDKKAGDKFMGIHIQNPGKLSFFSFDRLLVTAMGKKDDLLQHILKTGIPHCKIILL